MQITITWQSFITASAVVGAVIALVTYFSKVVRWVDKQNEQDEKIKSLKEEQALLVHGVLACLKGLSEKGCNGPVTEAINQFEEYLNKKAHE
jgi:hypothetical protein